MQWTASGIFVWFFPRDMIPPNIADGRPDPTQWGEEYKQATFQGDCDFARAVKDRHITFDTKFCGDWAGGLWAAKRLYCKAWNLVRKLCQYNPTAFEEAYWPINFVKVYQVSDKKKPEHQSYDDHSCK